MAVVDAAARQDTWEVHLTINGEDFGVWDTRTGGDVAAQQNPFRPGGLGHQRALGGPKTIANVVVTRLHTKTLHARLQKIISGVGAAACVVQQMPLDGDKNAWGRPIVWQGSLDSVAFPDHDSNATGPSMLSVTITPDGDPTSI